MIKKLKIKINELTGSKYRKLRKFYEKGNEEIDIENITSDPQTKLARLWVNLPSEWGDCWMPLDGALTENELEGIEEVRIRKDYKGYKVLLFFKKITKKPGGTYSNRTMSVASVEFPGELRYDEIPSELHKIKRKIPRSKVYEISTGEYAGCYAIKTSGYWSPPLFRTSFDCGIYDGEGRLIGI